MVSNSTLYHSHDGSFDLYGGVWAVVLSFKRSLFSSSCANNPKQSLSALPLDDTKHSLFQTRSSGLFAEEAHLELTLFKSKRLAQREFASGIFKKEVNSIPRALTAYLVYCP